MVTRSAAVTMGPGPLAEVVMSPPQITLQIQDSTPLGARALDQFGNEISDAVFSWSAPDPAGSIDETGLFTAGTRAGTYQGLIKVTVTQGALSRTALVGVTIEAGPLSTVVLEPSEVALDIGATQSFSFIALDEFGNEISDAISSWIYQAEVGAMDTNGVLTAGTKAGAFQVHVNVARGTARAFAIAHVSIGPDPLASIDTLPSFALVEKGGSQQFEAVGFDRYGNEIIDLAFIWKATGGEITQEGLFSAGGQSGAYEVEVAARFKDNTRSGSATIPIPPVWLPVGNMLLERTQHRAILLADGKVLVLGDNPAEIYDSITRTFSIAENSRCNHGGGLSATLLGDGRVLIAGGTNNPRCAEVYDSEAGVFSRVGDLNVDHYDHIATLLLDGRVLIAGGAEDLNLGSMTHAVAEIYDPVTEAFSLTGSLSVDRFEPTSTLLPSGQVLITGGVKFTELFTPTSGYPGVCVGSPELYDPSTGTFSSVAGGLSNACHHTATPLNNGNVLITLNDNVAYLFDLATGTFRLTGTMTQRGWTPHAATLLPTGQVLITGGSIPFSATPGQPDIARATTELYDPTSETFTQMNSMSQARWSHTATLLSNGHVLVVGGVTTETIPTGERVARNLNSAELWIPQGIIQPASE